MQAGLGMCRLHISDDWFCLDPGIMISMKLGLHDDIYCISLVSCNVCYHVTTKNVAYNVSYSQNKTSF